MQTTIRLRHFSISIPSIPPGLIFWVTFLLLNTLLYLPIYYFQKEDMAFFPWNGQGMMSWEAIFRQRDNLDPLRLNLEFSLLVLVWYALKPLRRRMYLYIVFVLYLLQLVYGVYEGFFRSFYQLEPNIYNDLPMIFRGTGFVLGSLQVSPVLMLGASLLIILAFRMIYLLQKMVLIEELPAKHVILLAFIIFAISLSSYSGKVELHSPDAVLGSFTARIIHNYELSKESMAGASRFEYGSLAPYYPVKSPLLEKRPNIHILFIESYGSVLYKRPDFRSAYTRLLPRLDEQLSGNGWHSVSALSNSPMWGGGSWIAYTSFIFGMPLESNNDYLLLRERYNRQPFPHLFNYLGAQGYRNYALDSGSGELNPTTWQLLVDLFGIEQWLRVRDIPYRGPLYGWGPSLPDQYALNYALEYIKTKEDNPYTFFHITQNSHYPWYPLPSLEEDWRALDLPQTLETDDRNVTHGTLRRRYYASIEYELKQMVDLIIKQGEPDDIFIIIGDHQPARVSRRMDGWDTPVHIISRDRDFISSFEQYDFSTGLLVPSLEPTVQHAGIYSLLSRILTHHYGSPDAILPDYHPGGATLNPVDPNLVSAD